MMLKKIRARVSFLVPLFVFIGVTADVRDKNRVISLISGPSVSRHQVVHLFKETTTVS